MLVHVLLIVLNLAQLIALIRGLIVGRILRGLVVGLVLILERIVELRGIEFPGSQSLLN